MSACYLLVASYWGEDTPLVVTTNHDTAKAMLNALNEEKKTAGFHFFPAVHTRLAKCYLYSHPEMNTMKHLMYPSHFFIKELVLDPEN
jgi:hypothetical protein